LWILLPQQQYGSLLGPIFAVRNTKQVPVNLVVADVFPTSSDSKIRVVAVEPSQSAIDAGTQSEEAARPGAFDDSAVGEMALEGDGDVEAGATPVGDAALRKITFKEVVARNPLTNNVVWSKRVPAGSSVVLPVRLSFVVASGHNTV
jgi:hypothetical protein